MKKMDKTPKRSREEKVAPGAPKKKRRRCQACVEEQPNQQAHYGGCMPDPTLGETWEDFK